MTPGNKGTAQLTTAMMLSGTLGVFVVESAPRPSTSSSSAFGLVQALGVPLIVTASMKVTLARTVPTRA